MNVRTRQLDPDTILKMNVDGQRILQDVQREFMECVDARAIVQKARMKKIIAEAVESQINESRSSDAAKNALFEHLHDQAMLEDLRHFCIIMIESEGYKRMQMFGKELLAKLEEVMPRPGSSQVSSAAASDVEMEGGSEQQRALGKAWRKRPPEDHADGEWKRQKDSDSAVHGGAANYALGEAQRKRPPEDHTDLREGKRQRDSDSAAPMSDYNSNALIAFREKLKTNIAMKPHLFDMLDQKAGGFMTRAEAKSVRNAEDPMGWLIEILLGKGDKEFNIFCDMLDKSNHRGWAASLRQEAKPNRQKEDQKADVLPAYDVEEIDRDYLEKAIMTVMKDKKLDTLKLMKGLYRHTYFNVECILKANAECFRNMVRVAVIATEDEEAARALTTTHTVIELLDKLRMKTKWEDTELLTEIVYCLPEEARTLARSLLKRYEGYLDVYDNSVPAQDSLQMQLAVPEGTKPQVPVEVKVSKCLAKFMNKDCKDIVNLLLHNSYKIPRIKIMATDVKTGCTTVVFLIDKDFTENIIHSSRKVSSLWAFQELCVTRVHIGDFELNVVQLLTQHFKEALHSGLTGGMDFVGATKALPYQVYVLVDPDIVEELVIRTVYRKIAHPCPEQEELVSGTADDEGVETTPEMYEDNFPPKVEEEAEPHDKGKVKEATESGELSRVQELEDKLKNSEEKRMDLTDENMALMNRLKVYREQKDHTEQEMANLKKRLVSMLSSQGGADKDSALTTPSDVCSKRIPHRWWLKVSAGSYNTSLLPSSPMKQAEGSREMEGEVVFGKDTKSNLLKAVSGTEWMYRRGVLERGRRANLRRHQFTRYHRRWLTDNVQKEEEDSCKLWLLQSSPNVGTVREREEHGVDEGKMSERVTGSGELLSRVKKLEDELKDSERKRMDLIQSNTALQKNLKACREQEVHAQQEIASLWERLDEGKMSEGGTGSGELLSCVQELEGELKNSERKRMNLIQSNTALQKILKACREQEVRAQQEIASLWERLGGAEEDSTPTAPSEGPLKRIPRRWWLKVAGSYDTSLLPSAPMEQAEGVWEMEGEVVFRRDPKSNLLKAVSGTEWMYRRGALERGRRSATANLHQHKFTRYHQSWLTDNVQKEEEEFCKQWLLQSSPDEGSVREGEEQGLMSKVYKQALRDYQVKIAGVLIVNNIISDLKPYLTKVEYLQVKSKLGNMTQVDELFRILLTKGNGHFKGFCHVLEANGYQHWAQQLQSSTDGVETEVLSELYQEKLVTEDEVKRMKEAGGFLSDRVVLVQYTKPPEVVARTGNVLNKYEHIGAASLLKVLNELFTRHLLTAEDGSEVARKGWRGWGDRLAQVLLTKPAEVVQEACQVMKKHGYSVKKKLKSFTEGDCSTLYHRAIRDNPTITVHVSKAMIIGPPQSGKTALLHHLLELEPPEVSSSTPVMKTAETISVCPSGSAASPGEVGHVPPSGADPSIEDSSESEDASSSDESDDPVGQKVVEKSTFQKYVSLVTKNKWVLVNNDSGILSLLTHLRDTIAPQTSTAQEPVDYEITAEDSILPSTHETGGMDYEIGAEDIIFPSIHDIAAEDSILHSAHETEAEDVMLPTTHEDMHREVAIQPSGDQFDSVALMSSRIYRELQSPDLDNVALSDAHLLQFIECGGQPAYHDILPLFVNIPAIYLNVFNLAEELTECPIDELCSTKGNKMYAAKSALSVAEMITRSVMTVRSSADRKVPLLPDVMCESKPRVILVGTHLDKLDENKADEKLKAANDILHKSLQSKSCLLERAVVPNEKSQLMFFPVNNKLYVDKSHQSHKRCKCKHCCATKNLKGRITKQAMKDAVKVDVPVRWYLHQLLELSQSEKPFYLYSELYEKCRAEGSVTDVGEFHAMVTYFHALGLLVHLCGIDVGHTEESACLVFTNPSYLFENISKLYLVQFEDIMGGDRILLKHEGKLTRDALQELGVQLNPDHFMDLLVQLFIGAEIKSQEGGRVLFVPSVLTSSPDDAVPLGVSIGPQEDSLGFAITFENTSFIPCGVFTGMSARLQNAPGWEIFTKSISRKCMTFTVGTEGTVTLFDYATHISVSIDRHEGEFREYRDTVIEAITDSYCFLFHGKSAKDPQSGPCSECVQSPYLVLGQTCQECRTLHDTPEAPHFAELKVYHVPIAICCPRITTAKKLHKSEYDLFQNMSHYAVVKRQHTGCTVEGKVSGGLLPSQAGSKTRSSPHPPIGTQQTILSSQKAQASSTGN